jgi:hypothetical protein
MTERRRRPHPAHRARIVTAGVSAATVLGITAALGLAQQPAAAPPGAGSPTAVSSAAPGDDSARSGGVRPATPAPFATTTTRPDATTHGSR